MSGSMLGAYRLGVGGAARGARAGHDCRSRSRLGVCGRPCRPHVTPPKLPPPWLKYLFGSLGGMLARSLRISNRKLREQCGWAPKYPSMREGWLAVVAADHGARGD